MPSDFRVHKRNDPFLKNKGHGYSCTQICVLVIPTLAACVIIAKMSHTASNMWVPDLVSIDSNMITLAACFNG